MNHRETTDTELIGPAVAELFVAAFQEGQSGGDGAYHWGDFFVREVKRVGSHIIVRIDGPGSQFDDQNRQYWVKLNTEVRILPPH